MTFCELFAHCHVITNAFTVHKKHCMAMLQLRVDDSLKGRADSLFVSLGLDTSTAICIVLASSVENDGLPFPVWHSAMLDSLAQAVDDTRSRRNLSGPFKTAQEAVDSMLGD